MVIKRVIVFLLVLFLPVVVQAKVSAKVDRTTIEDGETFQLTLQYDDDEPDIEDLKKFFDVLGTSRSSKVSIINGSVNRVNEWLVTLAPRNIGQQVIPSIKFGNEATPPIQIKVIKPSVATAGQGADIFLEAKVDQPKAYVQSQIVFTIRLYRAVDIKEASLTEPAFDDAIVERMGDDVTFQTRRAGRLYNVTQRRYAIFAQQSGILEIPEMVFQGLVLQPMRSSPNMDPFNRFFQTQPTRRVRVRSEKLSVEVMPQPASYSGEHWLPAKRLILTESWSPEKPEFKVGEPVTRTLRLQATGLTGSQLPELKLFDAHGIKHYADQPAITTSVKDNNMLAVREEKFAIIPTQPGKLVLPEVRLSWWNTEFEREETLNIPPRIIDVAPAAVSSANAASTSTAQPEPASEPEVSQKVEKIIKQVADPGLWPLATAAFALAWLVTLVVAVLIWKRNPVRAQEKQSVSLSINKESVTASKNALKKACSANDPEAAQRAILNWGQAVWPESPPRNLETLGKRLHDSTVKQAFNELAEHLYKDQNSHWNGDAFWDRVATRLKEPKKTKAKTMNTLPALYPQ